MKTKNPRGKLVWLALAVLVGVGLYLRTQPVRNPAPPVVMLGPPAAVAASAPALPPGASLATTAPVFPNRKPPGFAPALQPAAVDRYPGATVLSQKETPAADGKITRSRLVKTALKYPLLRVEDTLVRGAAGGADRLVKQRAMVADHVMVKAKAGVAAADFEKMLARHGATVRKRIPRTDLYLVSFPAPQPDTVPDAVRALTAEAALIQYAEPDYLAHPDALPNGPRFPDLWNLHNSG